MCYSRVKIAGRVLKCTHEMYKEPLGTSMFVYLKGDADSCTAEIISRMNELAQPCALGPCWYIFQRSTKLGELRYHSRTVLSPCNQKRKRKNLPISSEFPRSPCTANVPY